MKTILYLNDNEMMKKLFGKIISNNGYDPLICSSNEELIHQFSIDRVIEKNPGERMTLDSLSNGFKDLWGDFGLRFSESAGDKRFLEEIMTSYINSKRIKKVDAMILDEMFDARLNKFFENEKNLSLGKISKEKYGNVMDCLQKEQLGELKNHLVLIKSMRGLGYNKPIVVCNEIDYLRKYEVDKSFEAAGADMVLSGMEIIKDKDNFFKKLEGMVTSKNSNFQGQA